MLQAVSIFALCEDDTGDFLMTFRFLNHMLVPQGQALPMPLTME